MCEGGRSGVRASGHRGKWVEGSFLFQFVNFWTKMQFKIEASPYLE